MHPDDDSLRLQLNRSAFDAAGLRFPLMRTVTCRRGNWESYPFSRQVSDKSRSRRAVFEGFVAVHFMQHKYQVLNLVPFLLRVSTSI